MPEMTRLDIRAVESQALTCTRCPLSQSRTQVVWADGNLDSDVMIIGEAPGFHEDQEGRPFVGAAGKLLDRLLGDVGLDRTKVAIVNVLKCRPPGNRDPLPSEIETCKPYLQAQLAYMQPKVIVTLGNFATRFILEEQIGITKARGRRYLRNGSVVVPTFHPAAALRGGRWGGVSPVDAIREDLGIVREVLEESRPKPVAVEVRADPPTPTAAGASVERTPAGPPTPAAVGAVAGSGQADVSEDTEQLGLF